MQNEEIEISSVPTTEPERALTPPSLKVGLALFNWAGSVVFMLAVPLLISLIYMGLFAPELFADLLKGKMTLSKPIVLANMVGLLLSQILSLLLSWFVVTRLNKEPFAESMKLQWSERFQVPQALLLGLGMFFLSLGLGKVLPQHETDIDLLLKFGLSVRVLVALAATIGAPLHEEIVYRGVLYGAMEEQLGKKTAVILVSLLFGAVHFFQYRNSPATLVAVMVLSFVLTILRAWTGKLLPCIATHFFFNGVQGVILVFAPDPGPPSTPTAQPAWLCSLLAEALG